MDLAFLRVRVGVTGASETVSMLTQVDVAINRAGQSANRAGGFFGGGLGVPLLALVGGLDSIIGGFQELGSAIGNVTGLSMASQFADYQIGFTTLLGSAEQAQRVLAGLRQMGATTKFNTAELIGYSRFLLAAGFNANNLIGTVGTLADTISATGLGTEAVGRLSSIIGQVRSHGVMGRHLFRLAELGLGLDTIVGPATGRTFSSPQAAQAYLKPFSPEKQVDIILKGLDKRFHGLAEEIGTKTPSGLFQNIGESLQNSMLPTGGLQLPVLVFTLQRILDVTTAFQHLNEITGGAAGLIGLAGLLYKGWWLITGSMRAVIKTLNELTISLREMAGAAGAAGGGAAGGGGVRGFLRGNAGLIAALAGTGLSMLGGALGGPKTKVGEFLGNVGAGAQIGALGGAWGSAIGAAAGGVFTAYIGLARRFNWWGNDNPSAAQSAAQRTAKATEETAASLKDMKMSLMGGGPNSRRGISAAEAEMAWARWNAIGVG